MQSNLNFEMSELTSPVFRILEKNTDNAHADNGVFFCGLIQSGCSPCHPPPSGAEPPEPGYSPDRLKAALMEDLAHID